MTLAAPGALEHQPPAARPALAITPLRAWIGVAVLWLFYVLSLMDRGVIALMVTPIMEELAISQVQVGVLQGFAFATVYCLAAIPLGWAVDRLARRKLLLAGVLVWSCATIGCAFAQGYAQITVARAFVGLGEAVLIPTALSLIADLFPRDRIATATALFSSGATVGAGAALMLGGALLRSFEEHGGPGDFSPWRAVFLLFGVLGLFAAWLCFLVPDGRLLEGARARADAVPSASMAEFGQFLLGHRVLLLCLFLSFPLLVAISNAFLAWAPHHFETVFGWNPRKVGLVLGTLKLIAPPLGVICGGLVMDKALRAGVHAPYFVVPLFCTLLGAPVMALGLINTDATTAIALLAIGMFIFNGFASSQWVLVQLLAPPALRGRLAALYMLAITLIGTGVGALLPPLLNEAVSITGGDVGRATALAILVIAVVVIVTLTLGRGRLHAALANAARAHPSARAS